MKNIAIIGGGAAGLAAAVAAGMAARKRSASDLAGVAELLGPDDVAGPLGSDRPLGSTGSAGVKIAIFEASERVGRPILASGNGRCNFSNAHIDASQYHNGIFAAKALAAFESLMVDGNAQIGGILRTNVSRETLYGENDDAEGAENLYTAVPLAPAAPSAPNGVVRFFESFGLLWREEAEGRLYPKANKASVVLDILRAAADALGVEIRTGAHVERVELPASTGARFTLRMADGVLERADAVIVACGGSVVREMLPGSFAFAPQRPVLGPIATDTRWVKQLDNIRIKCAVELLRGGDIVTRETGEVLFRKYGVSGIAVFNLSRLAQPGDTLSIDLFPDIPLAQVQAMFAQRLSMLKDALGEGAGGAEGSEGPGSVEDLEGSEGPEAAGSAKGAKSEKSAPGARGLSCKDFLRGAVLPQVARVLCEYVGLEEDTPCTQEDAAVLASVCKSFRLEYCGVGDASQCQVHRGGFMPEVGFSAETMQALDAPGLFVAGEALDIDGPCGGYNLHWAFASGILAGAHAVAVCG